MKDIAKMESFEEWCDATLKLYPKRNRMTLEQLDALIKHAHIKSAQIHSDHDEMSFNLGVALGAKIVLAAGKEA